MISISQHYSRDSKGSRIDNSVVSVNKNFTIGVLPSNGVNSLRRTQKGNMSCQYRWLRSEGHAPDVQEKRHPAQQSCAFLFFEAMKMSKKKVITSVQPEAAKKQACNSAALGQSLNPAGHACLCHCSTSGHSDQISPLGLHYTSITSYLSSIQDRYK